MAGDTSWVALADIMRPHGVAGELRLRLYNADSDVLVDAKRLMVRDGEGREREMAVEWMRSADRGHLLAKLKGIDTRDDADTLRGGVISARRREFAPLDEGEFYACDLVGARLMGPDGELGIVEELRSYPSTDVLLVRPARIDPEKPERRLPQVEIPLVDDYVVSVDIEGKQIIVRGEALQFFES
ncbi:MAG TPA: ribosome maturation factor RimM [Polyangiaceae bacterium]|jgi:16S rRNA processing protein RimM